MKATIKKLTVALAAVLMTTAIWAANTWWVACEDPNASDEANLGTEEVPFKTIQAAIDNANCKAGDTINVKRGVYATGSKTASSRKWRVVMDKALSIIAVEGPEKTVIKGEGDWAADPSYGCGPNSVGGIYVSNTSVTRILQGFTLTGCSGDNWGSVSFNDYNGHSFFLADCIITNNTAANYCFRYHTLVRCFIADNRSKGYVAGRSARYVDCIFTRNRSADNYAPSDGGTFVNCSLVDNNPNGVNGGSCYNTLISCTYTSNISKGTLTIVNCINSDDSGIFHVASPLMDDFRLLPSSAAVGAGLVANRDIATVTDIPAVLRTGKDFYGNPIPTEGACHVGAVQATMTPQGAGMYFNHSTLAVSVDGHRPIQSRTYHYGDCWPTQYVAQIVTTGEPFCLTRTNDTIALTYVWPDPDNNFTIVPAGDSSLRETLVPVVAAKVLWCSPDGSDSNAGTEGAPYQSIQKAMTSVGYNYTLIKLKAGTYDKGSDGINRVLANQNYVTFTRSVEGADKTTIRGDSTMRCFNGGSRKGALQGVTLTGGSRASTAGCGWYGSSTFSFLDCVVTGNSVSGALTVDGRSIRCRIVGNTVTSGSLVSGGVHSGLEVGANTLSSGVPIFGADSYLSQATVAGTSGATFGNNVTAINTIFVGSGAALEAVSAASVGNIASGYSSVPAAGFTVVDPVLADVANGDLRPVAGSPAIGGGVAPAADNYAADSKWYRYAGGATKGSKPFVVGSGNPTVGAWQSDFPFGYSISDDHELLAISGAERGKHLLEPGESITFTVSRNTAATRYCLGYLVNGELVSFDDYPSGQTFTVSNAASSVVIESVMSKDWYVAVDGKDTNSGFTPDDPLGSFAAAMEKAESGDTVWALPGAYSAESVKADESHGVSCRVVVKSGVTLRSTEGAAATSIVGASAVRCVWLRDGAAVKGFTLTGGRANYQSVARPSAATADDRAGGVYGETYGTLCEDCIINDCRASIGGGGFSAIFNRCVFRNCQVPNMGSALLYGRAVNCFMDDNLCDSSGGSVTYFTSLALNCTFGVGNRIAGGSTADQQPSAFVSATDSSSTNYKYYNNLVLCSSHPTASWNGDNKYCVFAKKESPVPGRAIGDDGLGEGSVKAYRSEMDIDTAFNPAPGSCGTTGIVTDQASLDLYRETIAAIPLLAQEDELDCAANPRVLNGGHLDVGAYEFDWRKRYAKDVGLRGQSTFGEISPDVVEDAGGKVEIPDGGAAVVRWVAKSGVETLSERRKRFVSVQVAGEGTLTVLLNGEPFATVAETDEPVELAFENDLATNELSFAFEGEGAARLLDFRSPVGMLILVR